MLEGNEVERAISTRGFSELGVDELIDGVVRAPRLCTVALTHRPDLVARPEVWLHDIAQIDAAFIALEKAPQMQMAGLAAMIAAKRDDLAARAVRELGALNVLQVVATLFGAAAGDQRRFGKWLTAATYEPASVAQFLADEQTGSGALLSAIAHLLPPDAVPNDYGIDPWLTAVRGLDRAASGDASLFLCAYLLSRALGSRSRDPGELAQISFEPIHVAASGNRLPEEAWQVLEDRLPRSFSWFDWDRCPRIRAAVGDLFIERELSPQAFAQIAKDDEIFAMLVETVARNRRGRDFLKRVRHWMRDENMQAHAARIKTIEKFVDWDTRSSFS